MWPASMLYVNHILLIRTMFLHLIAHSFSLSNCLISPLMGCVQFPWAISSVENSSRSSAVASFSAVLVLRSASSTCDCVTQVRYTFWRLGPCGSPSRALEAAGNVKMCFWVFLYTYQLANCCLSLFLQTVMWMCAHKIIAPIHVWGANMYIHVQCIYTYYIHVYWRQAKYNTLVHVLTLLAR